MHLSVLHTTHYRYSHPPRRVVQLLRLTPLSFTGQNVIDWRIDVDCDARIRQGRDGYGNIYHMLYVDEPPDGLKVSVIGRVLTENRDGVIGRPPGDLPPTIFLRETPLTHADAALSGFGAALDSQGGGRLEKLHRLAHAIHARMKFDAEPTDAGTSAAEAFEARHGVCQDFSHIYIAVARSIGIPARYVSGHLFRRDGETFQEAAHAWVEGWVDELGWVAFDPTNGICIDDAYIRVATGLDYREAAPIAGARNGGGEESLAVDVEVRQARIQAQSQAQN